MESFSSGAELSSVVIGVNIQPPKKERTCVCEIENSTPVFLCIVSGYWPNVFFFFSFRVCLSFAYILIFESKSQEEEEEEKKDICSLASWWCAFCARATSFEYGKSVGSSPSLQGLGTSFSNFACQCSRLWVKKGSDADWPHEFVLNKKISRRKEGGGVGGQPLLLLLPLKND